MIGLGEIVVIGLVCCVLGGGVGAVAFIAWRLLRKDENISGRRTER
jgi:hypothetical protein